MSTRPSGTDRAPNFVVFVQSSLNVIATAMTAPDVIRISGPEVENLGSSALSKASMKPQADILCLQKVPVWCCATREAVVCTEIAFRHPQLYQHDLAAALIFDGL